MRDFPLDYLGAKNWSRGLLMSDFQDQFLFDRKGGSPLKSRHIISLAVMLAMSFAFSYFDQAKVVSNGEAASAPPQFFWPWVEGGWGI